MVSFCESSAASDFTYHQNSKQSNNLVSRDIQYHTVGKLVEDYISVTASPYITVMLSIPLNKQKSYMSALQTTLQNKTSSNHHNG